MVVGGWRWTFWRGLAYSRQTVPKYISGYIAAAFIMKYFKVKGAEINFSPGFSPDYDSEY